MRELITIQSDGATVPFWKRWSWNNRHGKLIVKALDSAGNYHDYLRSNGVGAVEARRLMLNRLIELEVPQEVTEYVIYWLGVYDSLPKILRWILNRIARGKMEEVEVEV